MTQEISIVFDFGGVLFDWNPHYLFSRFFNGDLKAIDTFLAEIGFAAWNQEMDRGVPLAKAIDELCQCFPQYTDLIKAYEKYWDTSISGPIQPSVEILTALKQAGYPLYALSNWSKDTFNLIRPKYGFLEWFDLILLSGEVKLIKPDPQIFTVFLERVGRDAQECLFIDDSPANIQSAGQMGFQTIHFKSPQQLKNELQALGVLKKV